ncbi:hypothetical protein [Methanoculleus chikugoensis]|uniref:hypothetical protein n=1 Tax=Methanoculleus chikugoensis TaxID=118126 RepID=UPI001FB1C50A|nr:hypothetical protein [Methanoculleus chikugoensis]
MHFDDHQPGCLSSSRRRSGASRIQFEQVNVKKESSTTLPVRSRTTEGRSTLCHSRSGGKSGAAIGVMRHPVAF